MSTSVEIRTRNRSGPPFEPGQVHLAGARSVREGRGRCTEYRVTEIVGQGAGGRRLESGAPAQNFIAGSKGNRMAKIGVDLDGVLYRFDDALRNYLVKHHNWNPRWCPEPSRWEFYEDWGLSLEGFLRICREAADAGELWNESAPIGGRVAVEALLDLRDAGHSVHVITHRGFGTHPAVSHIATATWLREWNIPYDTLTFSADKTIVKTDWMIEDNIDNYLSLEASDCLSVLIDRPWNQDLAARRVKTVEEFAKMVIDREAEWAA